jgi:hypothetical protein
MDWQDPNEGGLEVCDIQATRLQHCDQVVASLNNGYSLNPRQASNTDFQIVQVYTKASKLDLSVGPTY